MGRKRIYDGPCSVEGCERDAEARGWCRMHYRKAWKHGDPTYVGTKGRPKTPKVRLERVIPVCDVGGCTELALDRPNAKYCGPHHDIAVRTKARPRTTWKPTDEERFWAKVAKLGEENCWLWYGRLVQKEGATTKPYGKFNFGGRSMSVHRYSYEIANNVKLESHTPIHHTCGETLCVNPAHLQATTPHENTAEMLHRRWYEERIAELEAKLAACTCG